MLEEWGGQPSGCGPPICASLTALPGDGGSGAGSVFRRWAAVRSFGRNSTSSVSPCLVASLRHFDPIGHRVAAGAGHGGMLSKLLRVVGIAPAAEQDAFTADFDA